VHPRSPVVAPLLLVLLVGCDDGCNDHKAQESPARSLSPDASPAPVARDVISKVHTDVGELRQSLKLPAGVTHARWVTRRRGDGVLGPSDYALTAYVDLSPDGWKQLTCDAGAPGATGPKLIDAEVALQLLPASIVVPLSQVQGQFKVPTVSMQPGCIESASVLRIGSVDRIGDGLWIEAHTM
jgi:hypothetical protein